MHQQTAAYHSMQKQSTLCMNKAQRDTACKSRAWTPQHTVDRAASRRAVGAVPIGAALAERQAVDVWPMGGVRLAPAVDAAAAGRCDAFDLLHPSVRLKLGLQHILQAFCVRPACQLSNHSANIVMGAGH